MPEHEHVWEDLHDGHVFVNLKDPSDAVKYQRCPCGQERSVKMKRAST